MIRPAIRRELAAAFAPQDLATAAVGMGLAGAAGYFGMLWFWASAWRAVLSPLARAVR